MKTQYGCQSSFPKILRYFLFILDKNCIVLKAMLLFFIALFQVWLTGSISPYIQTASIDLTISLLVVKYILKQLQPDTHAGSKWGIMTACGQS